MRRSHVPRGGPRRSESPCQTELRVVGVGYPSVWTRDEDVSPRLRSPAPTGSKDQRRGVTPEQRRGRRGSNPRWSFRCRSVAVGVRQCASGRCLGVRFCPLSLLRPPFNGNQRFHFPFTLKDRRLIPSSKCTGLSVNVYDSGHWNLILPGNCDE